MGIKMAFGLLCIGLWPCMAVWAADDAGVSPTKPAPLMGEGDGQAEGQGVVSAAPTAAEAQAAFRAAREAYRAVAEGAPVALEGEVEELVTPTTVFVPGGEPKQVRLEDIKLVVDVENATLRQVVQSVVGQAAQHTGPWRVKWRLKPENMGLLEEQVNLTAEAPFGTFFALLAERVKNLTGTQLYVTVFSAARVILVTDTFY
ncbi:MAG: hypothetical protein ACK5YK_00175 [Pseudomonadota bacterium]